MEEIYDCLIVGGGAAGIGMAAVLQDLQVSRFAVLERNQIGATFLSWPEEMRFITPSFTSNAQLATSLVSTLLISLYVRLF